MIATQCEPGSCVSRAWWAAGAPPSMVRRINLHEQKDGLLLQVPKSIADRAPEDYVVNGLTAL